MYRLLLARDGGGEKGVTARRDAYGVRHLDARLAGRLGTGNGPGGAYLALLLGLIGASLGALALTRARRTG